MTRSFSPPLLIIKDYKTLPSTWKSRSTPIILSLDRPPKDSYNPQTTSLTLIGLGAFGILPPATSALLHNVSTIGISLRSMTNLLSDLDRAELKTMIEG